MSGSETDAENDISKNPCKTTSTMFLYIREILFLFALTITSYATLFNSVPKIGKAPTASPFFLSSSIVDDYYRGSMAGAFEHANRADLAIVMFYSPWDAESQAARPVIEAVARFFKDEVYFCAVSCWAPQSDCKQHYPKIRSFPVVVAYPQQGPGIQYRGPIRAGHIVRFIRAMLKPVRRVQTAVNVAALFNTYEAVVVGSFDFEGNLGGRGYFLFYSVAMRVLEHDFNHEIAFAVTTNTKDAAALNVEQVPSLSLHLWNGTINYSLDDDYTEDAVTSWILKNFRRPTHWLNPPGSKTMALSAYVSAGPSLVVFTPMNPLLPIHPVYSQVRELSIRYSNCNQSDWLTQFSENLGVLNKALQSKYQRRELQCAQIKQALKVRERQLGTMTSSVMASAVSNRTDCKADNCSGVGNQMLGPQLQVCMRPLDASTNFSSKIRYDTSMWQSESDEFGAAGLLSAMQLNECKMLDAAYAYQMNWYPAVSEEAMHSIVGLSCSTNRTLSFLVMDSLSHYQLAEGLGINVLDMPQKTAVVIIDAKSESHYLLKKEFSEVSLVDFVTNFTEGTLQRFERSTHDWPARSLTRHIYPVIPAETCIHSHTQSCIPELHSTNFIPTVMDPTQAVIVLFHSPLCAMCRSISHMLLLIARYFRHFPALRFFRIDGERNDLSWAYTMDTFPTLLFFPMTRKEESRVFSDKLPFTVKTLMHFVLANLDHEAKIPAMLSLCKSFEQSQTMEEIRNCKAKVHAQIQEGLSHSLNRMRSILARWSSVTPETDSASLLHREKMRLMHSLQFFRSAGFSLGSVDRPGDAISNILELYFKCINSRISTWAFSFGASTCIMLNHAMMSQAKIIDEVYE